MRPHFLFMTALLTVGCFQEIDFPGEQATIVTDPVNNEDTTGVNEAIFDEFLVNAIDTNNDGIDDTAVSALITIAADLSAEELCAQAQDANSFNQLIGSFNDARFAGTITLVLEDLLEVNGASGFNNNDRFTGNATDTFVASFFFVNVDNQTTVAAFNADNLDTIDIETIVDGELTGTFDGLLQLDFANDQAGDNINSVMDGTFFKASACDFDDIIADTIGL
jgi:hypothetical protein